MKGTYPIKDLIIPKDTNEEQGRTRKIFKVLQAKCLKGEYLSEHEKNWYCLVLRFSMKDDGKPEDFSCCDNPIFKALYLTYFRDLTGGMPYRKRVNGKEVEVGRLERDRDLDYLAQKAAAWEPVAIKGNHADELLQRVAKEYRIDLKEIEAVLNVKGNPFVKGTFLYEYKKMGALLRNKHIYLIALEIYEAAAPDDFISMLNGFTIEFTEYSLIHILNRHFAELTKQYDSGKDYHSENIYPRFLHKQIKQFLQNLDQSGCWKSLPIEKITFRYKGEILQLFIKQVKRQIKGQKESDIFRVETFYSLSEIEELGKLEAYYELKDLNEDLQIFIPIQL